MPYIVAVILSAAVIGSGAELDVKVGFSVMSLLIACFIETECKINKKLRDEFSTYDPKANWAAHFATDAELDAAGCFKDRGSHIIIGTSVHSGRRIYHNPKPKQRKPHLQIGGMGSWKTTAAHALRALAMECSQIIFEATCETALIAAHHRLKYGPVYIINPSGAYREQFKGLAEVRINPHADYWLDPTGPQFGIRCLQQAAFAIPDTKRRDPYWDRGAQDLYEIVLRCEYDMCGTASIGGIARLFRGDFKAYLDRAYATVRDAQLRSEVDRLIKGGARDVKSIHELIQNVCTPLAAYREPRIADAFSAAEITFGMARKEVCTIIWADPIETMGAVASPRRFASNCALAELQSEQFAGDVPVALLIDELGSYGTDEVIRTFWTTGRKFDAFPIAAINAYSSIEHLYGPHGAAEFITNAGCVQWMSVKDQGGCEALSRMLGETEVSVETASQSNPVGRGSASINRSYARQRRRLMEPYEIAQNLSPRDQIVFMDDIQQPIWCHKLPYFETELAKRARENPFAPKEG